MNEVTNIQLGREMFTIATDAYSTLQTYLHEIKKQVGDDGEEVVEEVELRMAELLRERGISKEKVILPKDVTYLKKQLGSPKDFKDEDDTTDVSNADESDGEVVTKRLFRDTRGGIIAGVCAGLAEYTGVPTLVYRLLFIALTFASGVGVLIYLLLWFLVPEAKTSGDILQMEGRPVTVDGLKRMVKQANVPGVAHTLSHTIRCYTAKLMRLFLLFVGVVLMLVGILSFAAATTLAAYLLVHGVQLAGVIMFPVGTKQIIALVCGFLVLALLATILTIIGKSMVARKWALPGWVLGAIIGIFITAASLGTALGIDAVPTVQNRLKSIEYSSLKPLTPFSSVNLKGSSAQYEFTYDTNYSIEIRSIGHIDTRLVKTTITNGQLTVDTTGLVTPSTDCSRGTTIFDLCPYGSTNVEILVHAPIAPDIPVNAPDVPIMNVFKPAPYL